MSNESDTMVMDILNIFLMLVKKPGGISSLRKLYGLDAQLKYLSEAVTRDPRIGHVSSSLLRILFTKKPEESKISPKKLDYRRPKSIIVQLVGNVTETDLKLIESQIVRLRGVISVTFQLHKCRVVVFAQNHVDPELILTKVREGCDLASSSAGNRSISARPILRRQKSARTVVAHNSDSDRRSCATTATFKVPASREQPPAPHPYLTNDADLFEVDSSRGVPQRQDMVGQDRGPQGGGGISGWLSGLMERTLFW
ncbi:unnamed protein product [Dibothriocephalus latus]|uniref:HMA domain-containing protein n=1 Tax=Dibothriocephalus latus TaxID=60516 RepID=A0A3P6P0Q3_DIBLA|nr:unnamed protein product [Dibothriocephalus latus]